MSSRVVRFLRNAAIGIGALLVLLAVVVLVAVRTDWFRNYVRDKIVSSVQDSTGGRVEVSAFDFETSHLRATVNNLVIHGTEPPDAKPFVSIGHIEADFRLFTSLKHLYDITFLDIDRPAVNITLLANGQTNIPSPPKKDTSGDSATKTVVDLAVGRFVLRNGDVTLLSVRQPLQVLGKNFRARLDYSALRQDYSGEIAVEPVYVVNGRNTPVNLTVALPVTLAKDRIDLRHATISSPLSRISVDGSVENMQSPKVSAHVQGRIAGLDLARAGNIPVSAKSPFPDLTLDADATASNERINVAALHVAFGDSKIEGSGILKDPRESGSLQVRASLALRELGQMANIESRPDGVLIVNGDARLDAANRYDANGNVEVKNLSLTRGKDRISHINLVSAFHADPQTLDLSGIHLTAFGGNFIGDASLADFERYKIDGKLRGFDIQSALAAWGEKLPYAGEISGPLTAQGDTQAAGTKSILANARLVITPGTRGIPVSGRLNASYNGAADDVVVDNSYVALPHSRLNLSGSLNKRLNLSLTSKDLHDLFASVPAQPQPPVSLMGDGEADFEGTVTGALTTPRLSGHLAVNRFAVEGRGFDALAADLEASPSRLAVSNASLSRNTMQAHADASLALRDWSPTPRSPLSVNATVGNGDLGDVAALAGRSDSGYSGALAASVHVGGTYGNPTGGANIQIASGTIASEPFNQIQLQINMADQLLTMPVGFIDTPAGRVDLKADFKHPRDSFSTGKVHAHLQSTKLELARLKGTSSPGKLAGTANLNVDIAGSLQQSGASFQLTAINADLSAHSFAMPGLAGAEVAATARTSGQHASYNLSLRFGSTRASATGTTELIRDYPTKADLEIASLPIERVLEASGQTSIPARGVISGSAHIDGTMTAPQGAAQIDLTKAVIYDEKIDQARMRITYLASSIDVPQFEIVEGPSRIDATAHYDHPNGNLQTGQARLTIETHRFDLGRSATIQRIRAGLGGVIDLNASAAATIGGADPKVLLTAFNGNLAASGIMAQGKQFGDLKLTASTQASHRVTFALDSNLAGTTIRGNGDATLDGQYPVDARLTFQNVAWSRLSELIGANGAGPAAFEATSDGEVRVQGPLLNTSQLSGSLNVTKLNVTTIPRSHAERPITIANEAPIDLVLDHGTARIRNVHMTGPKTDLQANGSAAINGDNLNLSLHANADLGVLQNFDRDIYSAGTLVAATSVRGSISKPLIDGQVTLENAGFSVVDVPVGISNANGSIVFNGNSAQIKTLQAESGGGKVSVSGSASFADSLRFGLKADASNIRIRVQQGVSLTANASIRVAGTTDNSQVTGNATVTRVSYAAQSDFGSMLTRSAPPVQASDVPSPFLSSMKLDVRVRSSAGMTVQSSLSEDLQADVDLHVRGSADEPGVQGRITISEGKLLFFGTTYTVDTGTIAFYNPLRIDPVLDLSLAARTQGVNVTLKVTGPLDNMKLSYTSDPPLQFEEIISLLASGKTPTSDPTLLANQPAQPQQGFQQMGESAVLGQAVANPVSNQLQRVFGVTQLKIDPTFTTGSNVPTARLALQQRITNNLTFTYVSAIDAPNSTVVRMEWAFNPQWSAVATRDQNGIFSVNFFYKREFH